MKHFYKLLSLSLIVATYANSQETINAKLLDSVSQQPIAYATISTSQNSGVISNNNGDFVLYLKENLSDRDSLFIRCLGYEPKHFLIKKFTDSIITLSPKSIELKEVLVSNNIYSVEEIIDKIKKNLNTNYDFSFSKSRLFYRSSEYSNILKNSVNIKKSTIPEFNQIFVDSLLLVMPKNADVYTEILGDLYSETGNQNSQKLDIIKASHLYDKNKEVSFEDLEEKFNKIIKKHVKRDSYFKIKSGLFGINTEIDSSFFETSTSNDAKHTQVIIEEKNKIETERKKDFLNYRKSEISKIQHNSFIFEDSDMNFLEKNNRYNFKIEDYSFLNDDFVYKISFTPKRKEDYKGIIYVNTDDFAIIRIDYQNVKFLKNFNLLGLSYTHFLRKGTLIYYKKENNKYALRYADTENGNKFGIDRPLKIIEKNKNTRGRRKQNELSSNIHFIISNKQKMELVVFDNLAITEPEFINFIEKPKIKPVYLPKYDPDFWRGYNIIEPNQAIKDFKSMN